MNDSKVKDQRPLTQDEIEIISHETAGKQHSALLRARDGEFELPWEVPEQVREILKEFGKVWSNLYNRNIMIGDKHKWIKQAEYLRREFGEHVSLYVAEAGKLHYEKKDDNKKRLSINGPIGLQYMIRELAYEDAVEIPEPIKPGVRIG